MEVLDGVWRLVDGRAWDEGNERLSAPYGANPIGMITFANGRMLAALCNGDSQLRSGCSRNYSSYGGTYTFDGRTLNTLVDIASDPSRVGGVQTRGVVMLGVQMLLRPPIRLYGDVVQRRELVWERVWRP
ncbi:lipocalin-like domain-containing protein [Variovorax brevis]|uniref:lipocalin-like domain-containing protein n=1 Tax=Variovorax brevis TaxID=3053503 RepID=UPI0033654605